MFARRFSTTQDDAEAFLEWLTIGLQFSDEYLQPDRGGPGRTMAAETLAQTPPPQKTKVMMAAGVIEILDTPPPSGSTCTQHSTTSP